MQPRREFWLSRSSLALPSPYDLNFFFFFNYYFSKSPLKSNPGTACAIAASPPGKVPAGTQSQEPPGSKAHGTALAMLSPRSPLCVPPPHPAPGLATQLLPDPPEARYLRNLQIRAIPRDGSEAAALPCARSRRVQEDATYHI